MDKKIIPREKWDLILKSMKMLNNELKKMPKNTIWRLGEKEARDVRAKEERMRRRDPRYNKVSGNFIDRTKRKNGGGDMPPRYDARQRQVARDTAAGRIISSQKEWSRIEVCFLLCKSKEVIKKERINPIVNPCFLKKHINYPRSGGGECYFLLSLLDEHE